MQKILFKNWVLWVDKVQTQKTYEQTMFLPCDCLTCQNFEQQKDFCFPVEVLQLFEALGIDKQKYAEILIPHPDGDNHFWYTGWYHFKGKFELVNPNVEPMFVLSPEFSIGFYIDNMFAIFEDTDDLVQVCFDVKLPWILEER